MGLFRGLLYSYVLQRLLGGRGHSQVDPRRYGPRYQPPRGGVYGPGWGFGYGPRAQRPSSRGRFGFTGPFPTYTRRTRGGSQVRVGGCCLPIPLLVLTTGLAAALGVARRRG